MPLARAKLIKGIAIAGGVLCVVGTSGVLMERHSRQVAAQTQTPTQIPAQPQPAALAAVATAPVAAPTPARLTDTPSDPEGLPLQGIELTSSPAASKPEADGAMAAESSRLQLAQVQMPETSATETTPDTTAEAACEVMLTAEPAAAAMVTLTLDAPCYSRERVAFHHEGMVFSELTDDAGQLTLDVPALAEFAIFVAAFQDGEGASADAEVTSLAFYDRSVVQWQGDTGVELHALEFGADYDAPGHVWAGAPRDATVAARGEGGFLTQLGNETLPQARMAQVYSFPLGIVRREGTVDLSVEAQVTEGNCGRDITAQVIHVSQGDFGTFHDLDVSMPACDAAGDYLLLKNLLDDLKIAAK